MDAEIILTRLRHALQALALPADTQLLLLPGFVPEVDELALSFDHWLRMADTESGVRLSTAQRAALRAVEQLLDAMSGQGNAHLWTRAALKDGEPWSRLRQAADRALRSFGWDLDVPPGRLFEYIEW
jgi:hypothetical protein